MMRFLQALQHTMVLEVCENLVYTDLEPQCRTLSPYFRAGLLHFQLLLQYQEPEKKNCKNVNLLTSRALEMDIVSSSSPEGFSSVDLRKIFNHLCK